MLRVTGAMGRLRAVFGRRFRGGNLADARGEGGVVPGGPAADLSLPRPLRADRAWRPGAWARPLAPGRWDRPMPGQRLSPDVALYHDCPGRGLSARQEATGTAPFALLLRPCGFGGRYLSLALDLPAEVLDGLRPGHILGLSARVTGPLAAGPMARLNLRLGPDLRRRMLRLPQDRAVEFELTSADLAGPPPAAGWVDLIFAPPGPDPIRIADVTCSRRPRAEP